MSNRRANGSFHGANGSFRGTNGSTRDLHLSDFALDALIARGPPMHHPHLAHCARCQGRLRHLHRSYAAMKARPEFAATLARVVQTVSGLPPEDLNARPREEADASPTSAGAKPAPRVFEASPFEVIRRVSTSKLLLGHCSSTRIGALAVAAAAVLGLAIAFAPEAPKFPPGGLEVRAPGGRGIARHTHTAPARSDGDRIPLKLWRHEAADPELSANIAAIERFNASQELWRVDYEILSDEFYAKAIKEAALDDRWPCILDIDQPNVTSFAWSGYLLELDGLIPPSVLESINSGAKGTFRGRLYGVGQFDVVLALFARRSQLQALGIREATIDEPYRADELLEILRSIKEASPHTFPLDINTHLRGEWITYGFSPWLGSGGGDLIDRRTYQRARGVLDGPESIEVVRWYKQLFDEELTNPRSIDNQGFLRGGSIFHYTGSWVSRTYQEAFGEDLLIMPPMDFGQGPKVASGSWQWSVSRTCPHPEGAAAFIEFLMRPEEIAEICNATGLVPVSDAATALTSQYREGGRWRLFFDAAKRLAIARPATPGYPEISSAFAEAMMGVRHGKSVAAALTQAVDRIEIDIMRNFGYGFSNPVAENQSPERLRRLQTNESLLIR